MNYQNIIDKYYNEDNQLRYIFMTHSKLVTKRALKICDMHPELNINRRFVEEAAMLHDIGIIKCKFYSKTHPEVEKSMEKAERSLAKFGEDGLKRFKEWEMMFE